MWFYLIAIITVPALLAIVAYVLDQYREAEEDSPEAEQADIFHQRAA